MMEEFKSPHQPGGTTSIVTNNCTSRILDRGTDPFSLGRWSYVTLRGAKKKKVILITEYRECTQSLQACGPTTSTAQQFRHLSKKWRNQNHCEEDPKPRLPFILDLQAWIEQKVEA
jgi:hypothetical protein